MPSPTHSLELQRKADARLESALRALNFRRKSRAAPYRYPVSDQAEVLIFSKARRRWNRGLFEPIVAFENFALRASLGEYEPRQAYPRFAHVFLGYLSGNRQLTWYFDDDRGVEDAVTAIARAVDSYVLPFATHLCQASWALDLVRAGMRGQAPEGMVVHPWPTINLPGSPRPSEA